MRNLLKYPITKDEIIKELKEQMNSFYDEGLVGDLRPSIYCGLIQLVKNVWDNPTLDMNEFFGIGGNDGQAK